MNTISEFDLHLVLEWLSDIEYTVSELNINEERLNEN